MKRAFDVGVSVLALVVTSPIALVLAAMIRIRLGSPVLFRQIRPGLNEEPFEMMKFRTMRDAVDRRGEPLPDSLRLTPLGTTLRRTSLDELPELLNVLRGEMSLVGPRPLLIRYTEYMSAEERRRYTVRPGITGWAQVNGRNMTPWDERLAMDLWYLDNRSFALDLRIIAKTVLRVISRADVRADAETVMQNLDDERRGWPK